MAEAPNRSGTTFFITGGASGLGLATAKLLISQGANVTIADRNADDGKKIAEELGSKCFFVECDVTQKDSVKAAIAATVDKFKTLNGIVNCAGVGSAFTTLNKKLQPHDAKFWDYVMKINVNGTFYCCTEGASAMAQLSPSGGEGERGVIINIASVAAYEGQRGQLAYSASKSAILGMTLPMARDLAKYGIRVMCVAPGIIDTPLFQSAAPKVKENLLAQNAYPKRFGRPEEFAHLVTAIVDNGYLNGETIRMDGGIRFANL